jgi:hypothetical protein
MHVHRVKPALRVNGDEFRNLIFPIRYSSKWSNFHMLQLSEV